MKTYQLESTYSNQKSFYGKASILKDGETIKLKSYSTIVAEYNPMTKKLKVNGWYSKTTAIHINEFLLQYGKRKLSKNEMLNGIEL